MGAGAQTKGLQTRRTSTNDWCHNHYAFWQETATRYLSRAGKYFCCDLTVRWRIASDTAAAAGLHRPSSGTACSACRGRRGSEKAAAALLLTWVTMVSLHATLRQVQPVSMTSQHGDNHYCTREATSSSSSIPTCHDHQAGRELNDTTLSLITYCAEQRPQPVAHNNGQRFELQGRHEDGTTSLCKV